MGNNHGQIRSHVESALEKMQKNIIRSFNVELRQVCSTQLKNQYDYVLDVLKRQTNQCLQATKELESQRDYSIHQAMTIPVETENRLRSSVLHSSRQGLETSPDSPFIANYSLIMVSLFLFISCIIEFIIILYQRSQLRKPLLAKPKESVRFKRKLDVLDTEAPTRPALKTGSTRTLFEYSEPPTPFYQYHNNF